MGRLQPCEHVLHFAGASETQYICASPPRGWHVLGFLNKCALNQVVSRALLMAVLTSDYSISASEVLHICASPPRGWHMLGL